MEVSITAVILFIIVIVSITEKKGTSPYKELLIVGSALLIIFLIRTYLLLYGWTKYRECFLCIRLFDLWGTYNYC